MRVVIVVGTAEYVYEADGERLFTDVMAELGLPFLTACGGEGICGGCQVYLNDQPVLGCKLILREDGEVKVPGKLIGWEHPVGQENEEAVGKVATVAVDIGTTTVNVAYLDKSGKEILPRKSFANPQRKHGQDVVSRIEYALEDNGASKLRSEIREALFAFLALPNAVGELSNFVGKDDVDVSSADIIVTGNTVMEHLLMGWPVDGLASFPFIPYSLDGAKDGRVEILPGISAFVGADILAGIYFLDIQKSEDPIILLDIGTNAEMALWTGGGKGVNGGAGAGRLYVSSAAAGPALEGGNISCGMPAVRGAICRVEDFDRMTVIGNADPVGLCGSGLIDLIALLRRKEIIDSGGLFRPSQCRDGGQVSSPGVQNCGSGQVCSPGVQHCGSDQVCSPGVQHCGSDQVCSPDVQSYGQEFYDFDCTMEYEVAKGVMLTAEDVQQVILAKSAIASGLQVLLEKAGLEASDIKNMYIAGAMGTAMNIDNLAFLGIVPASLRPVAKSVGNTSLAGAIKYAQEKATALSIMYKLKASAEVVELATEKNFENLFLENLCL